MLLTEYSSIQGNNVINAEKLEKTIKIELVDEWKLVYGRYIKFDLFVHNMILPEILRVYLVVYF